MLKLEVKKFKKFDSGKIKGVCDVLFCDTGLLIYGIKIIESPTSGHFYAFPSEKRIDKTTNEEKYWNVCTISDKAKYKIFHDSLDEAFKLYAREQKESPKPVSKVEFSEDIPF